MPDVQYPTHPLTLILQTHRLAELLKRTRPHLEPQIIKVQDTVKATHQKLDGLACREREIKVCNYRNPHQTASLESLETEKMNLLSELQVAHQALHALKHEHCPKKPKAQRDMEGGERNRKPERKLKMGHLGDG